MNGECVGKLRGRERRREGGGERRREGGGERGREKRKGGRERRRERHTLLHSVDLHTTCTCT